MSKMNKITLDHMLKLNNWRLNSFNKGYYIPNIDTRHEDEVEYLVEQILV